MTNVTHGEPDYDYLIIGAGPAGLQLGHDLARAKRSYLILEAGSQPGAFFRTFPRHRKLISINKIHTGYTDTEINLRWDWNSLLSDDEAMLFKNYSSAYFPRADQMADYLRDFAERFALAVECDAAVTRVARDQLFRVTTRKGTSYSSRRLVVASGLFKPYLPDIAGLELAEPYTDVSVDPADFKGQRVLIVGKGNSGFETANNLLDTASLIHLVSPRPITMAWKSKFVGHIRSVNMSVLDSYQLKSQNVLLDAFVRGIRREGDKLVVAFEYTHAGGEVEELWYDRVILCTGFRIDDSIFDESCRPELACDGRLPAQTSAWESVNVPDLYFAGTLTQMRDFKKKQSGFIHGFRYNVRGLHRILETRYHGDEWPSARVASTPEALTDAVIKRVNRSSALWQQTGFTCDAIVLDESGATARYYEDVPVDYVHDSAMGRAERYYVVTLEFGLEIIAASPDPFAVDRVHKDDVANAALSSGIHPIVRGYTKGQRVSEHHVIEDIASEWLEEVHTRPLAEYFASELRSYAQPGRGMSVAR